MLQKERRINLRKITVLTVINIFALSIIIPLCVLAQDRLTIMAYNLKEYQSNSGKETNYENIISSINPDILVAVEINDDSPGNAQTHANYFLTNVMNNFGAYSLEIHTTDIDDENAIYYNSEFNFIESKIVHQGVQGSNHPTIEYKLKHVSTGYEIIIYAVHLSSNSGGGSSQRDTEANAIRALTDDLEVVVPQQYFIAIGDFNFENGSNEDAFETLTNNQDVTKSGDFIDPKNGSFAPALYTFDIDGQESSFDERFDLILNSESLVNPIIQNQVKYVSNSFVVAGNDGSSHASDIFNNIPQSYKDASDHLPVYAEYDFGGPTPVELAFFTGSLNGNKVELRWRTETEVNNYGFDIERTSEDSDWSAIGFVEGNGNTNSPKYYEYLDAAITNAGTYNYRLKQLDNDGMFEYSDVVTVTVDVPVLFSLSQNYPNPFNPETRVDYTIPEQENVSLRVYNMLGELIAELVNEVKPAGTYTATFSPSSIGSGLPSGVYVYVLQTPTIVSNRKMTFLK